MKATTTVTLMATTMLLTVADSETPSVRSAVTAKMPRRAGRLIIAATDCPGASAAIASCARETLARR